MASKMAIGGPQAFTSRTLNGTIRMVSADSAREVVFVPMCHIGKEKSYAEIRAYLDHLKSEGYVTFCEGVVRVPFSVDTVGDVPVSEVLALREESRTGDDSLRLDTLRRKFRRVMGFDQHVAKKKRHVLQTPERLGMTTDRDLWVDYSIYDLVALYERSKGPIELTGYDFAVPLDAPDYRHPDGRGDIWTMALKYRDDLLVNRILASTHPKIAVVYGYGHRRWVKLCLRHLHGYRQDRKYRAKKWQEH